MNGPTFAQPTMTPAVAAPKPAPRPTTPSRPAGKPEADAGTGLRVLTYLKLHWLMIVFCGTLLGGTGAYAAWELLPSKFESYALLQVSSTPSTLASGNREQARTDFATYMKTTAALIKYEFVLNAALRDIKDLPTIKEQKDPIKWLAENLQVSAADGSEVIKISLDGHSPADTQKIVNAVQKAFMDEVVQKEVAEKKLLLKKVEDAKIEMARIVNEKAPKPLDKPAGSLTDPNMGVPNPAAPNMLPNVQNVIPIAAGPVPGDKLIALNPRLVLDSWVRYQAQVETLPLQINAAKRQLFVITSEVTTLQKAPVDPATTAMVEKDGDVVTKAILVRGARRDYNFAVAEAGGNMSTPAAIDAKKILDAREELLAKLKQEKIDAIEGARRTAEAKRLKAAWDDTKQRIDALEEQLAVAKVNLTRAEKMINDMPPEKKSITQAGGMLKDQYDSANTDLMTADVVLSNLIRNFYLNKLELESPPRVRVLQQASNPTQRDTKKQILGTVFAGLMGYVLLAMCVVAYETMGKRVCSLADLKTAGPAPVVGVIPCEPNEALGRDPNKRATASEAIDKLRTYVAQTWLSRGATTVAVTSPLGDEGKAFTAFGLASSLAQSGYKTLLVDFDLREPALHTYAGVPNQNGVCEVLRAELDVRTAIQFLPSGLHLLPAGKWSDEARKAAVGGKLEALLTKLKEPYDCVILHGHALLTVAESVEVARRCEVVLVCARYRETTLPMIRKATDRVATMEIPYSGIVYVGATENESLC